MPMQLLIGGVLSVVGTVIAHRWRRARGDAAAAAPALDVGQSVHVESWQPDGTARVVYRGTQWNAEVASRRTRRAGTRCTSSTRAARRSCSSTSAAERASQRSCHAPPGSSAMRHRILARHVRDLHRRPDRQSSRRSAWFRSSTRGSSSASAASTGCSRPGSTSSCPFVDRIAYSTTCARCRSTCRRRSASRKDNTQLQVDGILYFQVTDPRLASYGSSNYVLAITQLAQTTLRSVIGRMELDRTFEERDQINAAVVSGARRRRAELGRQGAALRDQGPDAARGDPALDAGADHRRAREARGDRDVRRQAPGADQRRAGRARGGDREVRRREAGGDQQRAGTGGGDPRHRRGERQGDPPGGRSDRRARAASARSTSRWRSSTSRSSAISRARTTR